MRNIIPRCASHITIKGMIGQKKALKSALLDPKEVRMLIIGHREQRVLHETAVGREIPKRNRIVREHLKDVAGRALAHQLFEQDQRFGAVQAPAVQFL